MSPGNLFNLNCILPVLNCLSKFITFNRYDSKLQFMVRNISFIYRITILYVLFGVLWILFSDQAVAVIATNPHQMQMMSTYKGWFYVLVTGILLFVLIRKESMKRNLIYRELLNAQEKAVESDKLKTAFLTNLSHYIRTPMNGILGFIEILDDKDTAPEKHQLFLSYINENSHSLLQTLNHIIEVSKIQQGLASVEFKSFSLNAQLGLMVDVVQLDLSKKAKPVTIKTSFGLPDGSDKLVSDGNKVVQILRNLLDNAVRFTAWGEVEIGYRADDTTVTFFVKDQGPGIAEEKRKSLFVEFMSNYSYVTTSGEGAGLGLYLSAGLAKLIDGKLWLEKTGPDGSIFCLSLRR